MAKRQKMTTDVCDVFERASVCAVCQEYMYNEKEKDAVTVVSSECMHIFHAHCVANQVCCPTCRQACKFRLESRVTSAWECCAEACQNKKCGKMVYVWDKDHAEQCKYQPVECFLCKGTLFGTEFNTIWDHLQLGCQYVHDSDAYGAESYVRWDCDPDQRYVVLIVRNSFGRSDIYCINDGDRDIDSRPLILKWKDGSIDMSVELSPCTMAIPKPISVAFHFTHHVGFHVDREHEPITDAQVSQLRNLMSSVPPCQHKIDRSVPIKLLFDAEGDLRKFEYVYPNNGQTMVVQVEPGASNIVTSFMFDLFLQYPHLITTQNLEYASFPLMNIKHVVKLLRSYP